YEFDRANNWELLEELCDILGNKEDTWYATCMEIYNYVQAYHALVFSADSTMVYNPTLYKLWIDVDGILYTIDPGQTITIS
ncbi:MAG: polysaccharide deacetylase, partial [Oscillospiraceae bacterium]|nr:polysaccharide deacetylase [Oscillospiraceae bacterium]